MVVLAAAKRNSEDRRDSSAQLPSRATPVAPSALVRMVRREIRISAIFDAGDWRGGGGVPARVPWPRHGSD